MRLVAALRTPGLPHFSRSEGSTGFAEYNRRPSILSRNQLVYRTEELGGRAVNQPALKNSNALKNAFNKTFLTPAAKLSSKPVVEPEQPSGRKSEGCSCSIRCGCLRDHISAFTGLPDLPLLHVACADGCVLEAGDQVRSASQVLRPDATSSSWTLLSIALEQLSQLLLQREAYKRRDWSRALAGMHRRGAR